MVYYFKLICFQFSKLSDDGNVYHTYCISYSKCLEYVEKLRKNENFVEFEKVVYIYAVEVLRNYLYLFKSRKVFMLKLLFYRSRQHYSFLWTLITKVISIFQWCSQDPRCRRLQLNDFLVAPMQHCTKLPLLLANIRKYTSSDYDKNILALTIGKVEISLRK